MAQASLSCNDVSLLITELQQTTSTDPRFKSFLEKLQSRTASMKKEPVSAIGQRGAISSRQLWKLRGELWMKAERIEHVDVFSSLLCCIWEVQMVCDACGLFVTPVEFLSAQYNVMERLVKIEAYEAASPRASILYRGLMQISAKDATLEISDPDVVQPPPDVKGNEMQQEKMARVGMAIFVAVMSCGSRSWSYPNAGEWFSLCLCAVSSFEIWLNRSPRPQDYATHIRGVLFHTEKILTSIGKWCHTQRTNPLQDLVSPFVCGFVRLCVKGQKSPSVGVATCIAQLPSEWVREVCWSCFCSVVFNDAMVLDGMKLMNCFTRRSLKSDFNRRDPRRMLKQLLELEDAKFERLPSWIVIHVLICICMSISFGNVVHLSQADCLRMENTINHFVMDCETYTTEMLSVLEALGQLAYSFRLDASSMMPWSENRSVTEWLIPVMKSFSSMLLTAHGSGMLHAIGQEKRDFLVSQLAASVLKLSTLSSDVTLWNAFEEQTFWSIMTIFTEDSLSQNAPLTGTGYRSLPRDVRVVMDSANQYASLLHDREHSSAALEMYALSCDLYAFAEKQWFTKRGVSTDCLSSRIASVAYHNCKTMVNPRISFTQGMVFLRKVVVHLVDEFEERPIEDLRKIINLYARFALLGGQTSNSEIYSSLTDSVLVNAPWLNDRPGALLRLFRCELLGSMKTMSTLKIHPATTDSFLQPIYFIKSLQKQGNKPTLLIFLRALLLAFSSYIGTTDTDEVRKQLKECCAAVEQCTVDQLYRDEILAFCHCVSFLFDALDASSTKSSEQDISEMDIDDRDWATPADVEKALGLWKGILHSRRDVLDPELAATVLHQCLGLVHARGWLEVEGEITTIVSCICKEFEDRLTETLKSHCSEPLPIPFVQTVSDSDAKAAELELSTLDDDKSIRAFQTRVAIQMKLAVWHFRAGRTQKARRTAADARRFAMGLVKSFSVDQQLDDKREMKNFTSGSAWLAQGLYVFCLLLMAEIASEFEEFSEAHYLLSEAVKLSEALRSCEMCCRAQILFAQVKFRSLELDAAEHHLNNARKLLSPLSTPGYPYVAGNQFTLQLFLQTAVTRGRLTQQLRDEKLSLHCFEEGLSVVRMVPRPHWSLELAAIELHCQISASEDMLSPPKAIALMIQYLEVACKHEVSLSDLFRFLSLAANWKEDLLKPISSDAYILGSVRLTEQFRASLDLGYEFSENIVEMQAKLKSVETRLPLLQSIADALQLALESGLSATSLAETKILLLLIAWNGSSETSSVAQDLSSILGLSLAASGYLNAATYFLTCCLGNGFRLQTLHNLEKKSDELRCSVELKSTLSIQPFEIRLEPRFLTNVDIECKARLDRMLLGAHSGQYLVSIRQTPNYMPQSEEARGRLLLVRYAVGRSPLVVFLPMQFLRSGYSGGQSMTPDTAEINSGAFADVLDRLSEVLKENRSSFQRDAFTDTEDKEQLEKWWRERVELDKNLRLVIQSVEGSLGPWRFLLMAESPTAAHLHVAQRFLTEILSLPNASSHVLQRSNDGVVEVTGIFLQRLKRMSTSDVLRSADFFHALSDAAFSKEQIWSWLMSFREFKEADPSTPGNVCATPIPSIPRSSRIRRMRSTSKMRPSDALPYTSPLPQRDAPNLGQISYGTPQLQRTAAEDCFRTPDKRKDHRDLCLTDLALELSRIDCNDGNGRRTSVLLVMDFSVQKFPWESLPCLKSVSFYRLPSLQFASYLNTLRSQRQPSSENTKTSVKDLNSTFYVLDPEGDLKDSRRTFEEWFQSIRSWTSISSVVDLRSSQDKACALLSCLRTKDVFLYFGHNCGESLFQPRELRRHVVKSVGLLMGCSSGKLKSPGEGSILEYLAAGSDCCIGNLWAVSDAEINRFSKRLIQLWMKDKPADMALAVSMSRSACRLVHLIGAAPVVYGIPTQIQFS